MSCTLATVSNRLFQTKRAMQANLFLMVRRMSGFVFSGIHTFICNGRHDLELLEFVLYGSTDIAVELFKKEIISDRAANQAAGKHENFQV